jgi:hypothetical protein
MQISGVIGRSISLNRSGQAARRGSAGYRMDAEPEPVPVGGLARAYRRISVAEFSEQVWRHPVRLAVDRDRTHGQAYSRRRSVDIGTQYQCRLRDRADLIVRADGAAGAT